MNPSVQKHNLARARVLAERTQKEFAALVDCPLPTLQAVELGKLQLPEELGHRASLELDVPLAWLRENNLQTPVLTRYGEPYERVHFLFAQVEKSDGAYPDARHFPGEYFESLLASYGRIAKVCHHLSDQRADRIDIVLARIQRFAADLERDFGVPAKAQHDKAEDVVDGAMLVQTMCDLVRDPDRQATFDAYLSDQIEGRKFALDYLRERSASVKAAEIPRLIHQLRTEKAAQYTDWQKRYAQQVKDESEKRLKSIRAALKKQEELPTENLAQKMYQDALAAHAATTGQP